jgi:hypothetical protein
VAAALVPLLAYDILVAAERWPAEPTDAGGGATASSPWPILEVVGLVAAMALRIATRFPFGAMMGAIRACAGLADLLTAGAGPQMAAALIVPAWRPAELSPLAAWAGAGLVAALWTARAALLLAVVWP